MSIVLHEAGFTDHLVYATDISEKSLAVATQCCRTHGDWEQAGRNYAAAGGTGDLAGYFADPDHADSMSAPASSSPGTTWRLTPCSTPSTWCCAAT